MTTHFTDRPDPARTDARLAKASTWNVGTQRRQREAVDAIRKAWESREWPHSGLLSYSVYAGEDGATLLHYSQWTGEQAYQDFVGESRDIRNDEIDAAVPGIERLGLRTYELYRSGLRAAGDTRETGCLVIVDVEFDGPDPARQRAWVDTVFEALGEEAALPMRRHRRTLPRQHRRHPGHQLRRVGERRAPHRGPRRTRRGRRFPVPALGTRPELPGHDRRRRPPLHPRAQHGTGRGRIGGAAGGMW